MGSHVSSLPDFKLYCSKNKVTNSLHACIFLFVSYCCICISDEGKLTITFPVNKTSFTVWVNKDGKIYILYLTVEMSIVLLPPFLMYI